MKSNKEEGMGTARQKRKMPGMRHAWANATRYLFVRAITVTLTVLIGIYGAIWLTNLGGISDEWHKNEIAYVARGSYRQTSWRVTPEERAAAMQILVDEAIEASGINRPFVLRSFEYFRNTLSLSLGETSFRDRQGSHAVIDVLKERLPLTLLLFGTANLISMAGGLFLALRATRNYGGVLDRAIALLAPLLSAPAWFHGILLILFFAILARLLPFGGLISPPIPETTFSYILSVLKHMILPVSACVLGTMPYAAFSNRALFLIHASDDYVQMGHAKGLPPRRLERNYILRPNLPPILASYIDIVLISWQGVILVEGVFAWPGLGTLLMEAILREEIPMVMGTITLFALVFGASVLFLDILYVLADPRVTFEARRGVA